jgi:hypothetical protein
MFPAPRWPAALARILILMKSSARAIAAVAAPGAALPANVLLILSGAAAALALLAFLGIALPAVWSARPPPTCSASSSTPAPAGNADECQPGPSMANTRSNDPRQRSRLFALTGQGHGVWHQKADS